MHGDKVYSNHNQHYIKEFSQRLSHALANGNPMQLSLCDSLFLLHLDFVLTSLLPTWVGFGLGSNSIPNSKPEFPWKTHVGTYKPTWVQVTGPIPILN